MRDSWRVCTRGLRARSASASSSRPGQDKHHHRDGPGATITIQICGQANRDCDSLDGRSPEERTGSVLSAFWQLSKLRGFSPRMPAHAESDFSRLPFQLSSAPGDVPAISISATGCVSQRKLQGRLVGVGERRRVAAPFESRRLRWRCFNATFRKPLARFSTASMLGGCCPSDLLHRDAAVWSRSVRTRRNTLGDDSDRQADRVTGR